MPKREKSLARPVGASGMAFLFRCPECRTRRRDFGLFTQHLRTTGHRLCRCGGYHYEHRVGSRCCEANPMSGMWLAARAGVEGAELLAIGIDIALSQPGRDSSSAACPF